MSYNAAIANIDKIFPVNGRKSRFNILSKKNYCETIYEWGFTAISASLFRHHDKNHLFNKIIYDRSSCRCELYGIFRPTYLSVTSSIPRSFPNITYICIIAPHPQTEDIWKQDQVAWGICYLNKIYPVNAATTTTTHY